MTVFVTVQGAGERTRLRRYMSQPRGKLICTHEGLYDPDTVSSPGVLAYHDSGPAQDRRGFVDYSHAVGHRRPA